MKLIEALQIVRAARARPEVRRFALVTGFTPLHLGTFLTAQLQQRVPAARVDVDIGLFGDLIGNARRAAAGQSVGIALVVEWQDLDRRLGVRETGGWAPAALDDVLETTRAALARLEKEIATAAERTPVVVCLPTLPLVPVAFTTGAQASAFELRLRAALARFAAAIADARGVQVVNEYALASGTPWTDRLSVRSELTTGFPYTQQHAAAVARSLVTLLLPAAPKKGLVTDLDDTIWMGILGEVGVDGVAWDLEHHAQLHGLYQQVLSSLADSGVLVAVASKNDASLVEEAFQRSDIALSRDRVFPLLANWGAKSASIDAVLQAWNVGADSLVFVDDSPIEIAEVQSRHPEVVCRLFPKNDPDAVLALLRELRDLFGRPTLQAEDTIRRDSLRSAQSFHASAASENDEEAFVAGLSATITIAVGDEATDARAFELINKTNQFNANGARYLDAEWTARLAHPEAITLAVSYTDKFGPLGRIAVLTGWRDQDRVYVERWVMSCRAFARRIEHATMRAVFDLYDASEVAIAYVPTARNTPMRDFLATLGAPTEDAGEIVITRAAFDLACPPLYHRVTCSALPEPANG